MGVRRPECDEAYRSGRPDAAPIGCAAPRRCATRGRGGRGVQPEGWARTRRIPVAFAWISAGRAAAVGLPGIASSLGRDDRPAPRAVPPAVAAPGVRCHAGSRRAARGVARPVPLAGFDSSRRVRPRLSVHGDRSADRSGRVAAAALGRGSTPSGQEGSRRLVHRSVLLQLAATRTGRTARTGQHGPARTDLEQRGGAGFLPGHHRIRDGAYAGAERHAGCPGGRRRGRSGRAGGRATGDPRRAAARYPDHLSAD